MLVVFLRSSLVGSYKICPHAAFLEYSLGIKPPSGHAAAKGTTVHKALELLAKQKFCQQKGEKSFFDTELNREYCVDTLHHLTAIQHAYEHYSHPNNTVHEWTAKDWKDCSGWFQTAITFNDGEYNPLNRNIICPEQYFDITITEPWAKYDYDLGDGKRLRGRLAIRGTMDLITRVDDYSIEKTDYKTGQCKDWGTGQRKTLETLYDDFQLRLYHYALSILYPDKTIFVTIYYIRDGGPFTLVFEPHHKKQTLQLIRHHFETIKSDKLPRRIRPNWWCNRLCFHSKTIVEESGLDTCEHYHRELLTLGMDRVVAKYADVKKATSYGEGGGSSARVG